MSDFTHNMEGQITGEIIYTVPYKYTYVYSDNRRVVFNNIKNFKAMKSGCYVLTDSEGVVFVVRPNYDWSSQEPETVVNVLLNTSPSLVEPIYTTKTQLEE